MYIAVLWVNVQVWDLRFYKQRSTFKCDQGSVLSIARYEDYLLSGGNDSSLRVNYPEKGSRHGLTIIDMGIGR
jgi:hypothetical protein